MPVFIVVNLNSIEKLFRSFKLSGRHSIDGDFYFEQSTSLFLIINQVTIKKKRENVVLSIKFNLKTENMIFGLVFEIKALNNF